MIAKKLCRELKVDKRAPSLVSGWPIRGLGTISDCERRKIIKQTFSEEELVRVADQIDKIYEPLPTDTLTKIRYWWFRFSYVR